MKDQVRVHLTEVQKTLLITLHAKAVDSHSKKPILNDEKAGELLDAIDYDFGKLKSFGNDNLIVVRAKQYDEWLREFLNSNPNAIVLNLGCGLDTRITRINPSSTIQWFDIDYPDVIQLRENFYSNGAGYRMIGYSITDPHWLAQIPRDRPTIVIADGVLAYLTPEEAKSLLNRITDHFLHGQIMFDVMNAYAIQLAQSSASQTTGALHKWAVENLDEVDELDAKLRRVSELSVLRSAYVRKLPWRFRLLYGSIAFSAQHRNMIRLLRYRF